VSAFICFAPAIAFAIYRLVNEKKAARAERRSKA
jgi:hypothetical protein